MPLCLKSISAPSSVSSQSVSFGSFCFVFLLLVPAVLPHTNTHFIFYFNGSSQNCSTLFCQKIAWLLTKPSTLQISGHISTNVLWFKKIKNKNSSFWNQKGSFWGKCVQLSPLGRFLPSVWASCLFSTLNHGVMERRTSVFFHLSVWNISTLASSLCLLCVPIRMPETEASS